MKKIKRIALRLLFDELLPWRVAKALCVLEVNASWVGDVDRGAPPRGSSDKIVLEYAAKSNQVVVTSNHDMIVLAAEMNVSVVWIDPRSRQLSRQDTVARVFGQLGEWDEIFMGNDEALCVHSLKTRVYSLPLDAARERALRRMREIKRRKAKPKERVRPERPDQLQMLNRGDV